MVPGTYSSGSLGLCVDFFSVSTRKPARLRAGCCMQYMADDVEATASYVDGEIQHLGTRLLRSPLAGMSKGLGY